MKIGIFSEDPYITTLLEEICATFASFHRYTSTEALLKAFEKNDIIAAAENHQMHVTWHLWNQTLTLEKPFSARRLYAVLDPWKHFCTPFSGYALYAPFLKRPDGVVVTLSPKEEALLSCFLKNSLWSRCALLQEVWGYDQTIDTHTLETHIYCLRQKLGDTEAASSLLITTSEGYQFKGMCDEAAFSL